MLLFVFFPWRIGDYLTMAASRDSQTPEHYNQQWQTESEDMGDDDMDYEVRSHVGSFPPQHGTREFRTIWSTSLDADQIDSPVVGQRQHDAFCCGRRR